MENTDLHPPDDYRHRFFIWHEWIQANGPLTTENVFEYFSTSMFYDKQSNNQVLRMQTMHTGMPILNEAEELRRFTGVEFALVHAMPPSTFIIHKRERLSPDAVRPLAAYFIVNNRIYQSPDLYTVLSNRLLTSLCSLQSSFDTLRLNRPDYTPRTGFVWPVADLSSDDQKRKRGLSEVPLVPLAESEQDLSQATTADHKSLRNTSSFVKKQNNMLLVNAMRTTAMESTTSFSSHSHVAADVETSSTETFAPTAAGPRSSATPAPVVNRGNTPKSTSPQDVTKPAPGAVKKKRKRTSVAAPPA